MIESGLNTFLKFTTDYEQQFHRMECCDLDRVNYRFNIIVPENKLLIPFQIRRPSRPSSITTFKLVREDESQEVDLSMYIFALEIRTIGAFDYITNFGGALAYGDIPCGVWYIVVGDGTEDWYSVGLIEVNDLGDVESQTLNIDDIGSTLNIDDNDNPLLID